MINSPWVKEHTAIVLGKWMEAGFRQDKVLPGRTGSRNLKEKLQTAVKCKRKPPEYKRSEEIATLSLPVLTSAPARNIM